VHQLARTALDGAERRAATGRQRRLVTLVAVVPILAILSASLLFAFQRGDSKEVACWILPNGHVLPIPGDDCPLRLQDRIIAFESAAGSPLPFMDDLSARSLIPRRASSLRVRLIRDGREEWSEISVRNITRSEALAKIASAALLAGILLCIPLFLLRHSEARAAIPFALFYSAISVIAVSVIAGRDCPWLSHAVVLSLIALPAVLTHLGLTFPTERRVIQEAPGLAVVPYLLASILIPVAWLALGRSPLVWPTFLYVLMSLTASTWMILIASCAFAIRESNSAIERARARALCFGSVLLPLIPATVLTSSTASAPAMLTNYLWSSVVVMPLPIGLAISRYNLFDLGWDARHRVGRVMYICAGALVVMSAFGITLMIRGEPQPLRNAPLLFLVAFGSVAAIETLRNRTLGLLDSMLSPRTDRLRRLRHQCERDMAELHDEDAVAARLADVLRSAIEPTAGCIFLIAGSEWRPAYPFGRQAPAGAALAADALSVLGGRNATHLALDEESHSAALDRVQAEFVEIVASIESSGENFGIVLLAGRRDGSPYSGVELDFVTMAASHAAVALRNARQTRELVAVEREATMGKVALALAHDLGKELDWITRLARRLPSRIADPTRLNRDVALIQEFAEGVVEGIREFVRDAANPVNRSPGVLKADDIVDRAIRKVEKLHGARVSQSIDPAIRSLHAHANLGSTVVNLLDNALRATPDHEPVRLFATRDEKFIRVVVIDGGCGIPDDDLERVFDPGFTTRADEGGLGIGLTVSREIVRALGGSIDLARNGDVGIRATVRVPATAEEDA
jgi:signal transduction histidine kinase